MASANHVLLRELLARGHRVTFLGKLRMACPVPLPDGLPGRARLVDVDNRSADRARDWMQRRVGGPAGYLALRADSWTYHRLLVSRLRAEAAAAAEGSAGVDAVLWLGDWARGAVPGVATVQWPQGPPGTDARSIFRRFGEVSRLAGASRAARLAALAAARLTPVGLPPMRNADVTLIGSDWSRQWLCDHHGLRRDRVFPVPYPIDLDEFNLGDRAPADGPLRVLWLGRFVPRKRLDLLLDAAAKAIERGVDLAMHVVGSSTALVPGYERLLEGFGHPGRLHVTASVPRAEVPATLRSADVLVQPSEHENFGSAVAEAMACGTAVIAGATNGTGEYLCPRSTRLADGRVETLAAALASYADRKRSGTTGPPAASREAAERHFSPARVVDLLLEGIDRARAARPGG